MSERYNGWTNYESWLVKLWMDNDEGSYRYYGSLAQDVYDDAEADDTFTRKERAAIDLANRLKDEFEENDPLADQVGVYADLLSSALWDVNWDEIANSLLEDVEESEEPEEEEDDFETEENED